MSDPSRPHWFPETEEEFGYYLARLLEGDGHFGDLRVVITFHSDDSSSADYLQRRFGYGSVYEIPDENTVAFVVRKLDVIEKILRLINGKFRGPAKVEQLKQYGYDKKFGLTILPPAEFSILNNHWLAGFVDADGHFGIRARKVKSEGKIVGKQYPDLRQASAQFNVSQKRRLLLDLLYGAFGGGVYYAATTDCYQY